MIFVKGNRLFLLNLLWIRKSKDQRACCIVTRIPFRVLVIAVYVSVEDGNVLIPTPASDQRADDA